MNLFVRRTFLRYHVWVLADNMFPQDRPQGFRLHPIHGYKKRGQYQKEKHSLFFPKNEKF